jgi:hypothetical protein
MARCTDVLDVQMDWSWRMTTDALLFYREPTAPDLTLEPGDLPREHVRAALAHVTVAVGNRAEVAMVVGELPPSQAVSALLGSDAAAGAPA